MFRRPMFLGISWFEEIFFSEIFGRPLLSKRSREPISEVSEAFLVLGKIKHASKGP